MVFVNHVIGIYPKLQLISVYFVPQFSIEERFVSAIGECAGDLPVDEWALFDEGQRSIAGMFGGCDMNYKLKLRGFETQLFGSPPVQN